MALVGQQQLRGLFFKGVAKWACKNPGDWRALRGKWARGGSFSAGNAVFHRILGAGNFYTTSTAANMNMGDRCAESRAATCRREPRGR